MMHSSFHPHGFFKTNNSFLLIEKQKHPLVRCQYQSYQHPKATFLTGELPIIKTNTLCLWSLKYRLVFW